MIEIPLPVSDHISREIIGFMAPFLSYENGPWIAGGVCRRLVMGHTSGDFDVDVFFKSKEQRDLFVTEMLKHNVRRERMLGMFELRTFEMQEEQGKTFYKNYRHKIDGKPVKFRVQYVDQFYFDSYEQLLDDFDFTVIQMVTDGKTIRMPKQSLNHINERRLSLNPNSTIRQISRLCRYMSYGFAPDETLIENMESQTDISYYQKDEKFEHINIDWPSCEDFKRESALSRVTDLHIVKINGQDIAFIKGLPFPLQLAYIFITSSLMRDAIAAKMKPVWGFIPENLAETVSDLSAAKFVRAYTRAI